MDYFTIVTTAGAALIAQAITEGTKLSVVSAAVGDGGGEYYAPTVDQTALKNETWRGEIAGASVSSTNPQEIDITIVVGTDVGGFVMREAGIFAEDGTLVAICNMPDTEKISITDGISSDFTLMMHIVVADPSVVEFTIDPGLDYVTQEQLDTAINAAKPSVFEITLSADAWEDGQQTVHDSRFVVDGYTYIISPSDASYEDYTGVRGLDVTVDGEITFVLSDDTPSVDLTVDVLRMEVE